MAKWIKIRSAELPADGLIDNLWVNLDQVIEIDPNIRELRTEDADITVKSESDWYKIENFLRENAIL